MMTNTEAIEILKNTTFLGTNASGEKTKKAVEMAVEALKKQVPKNPVINGDKNEFWTEDALLCPDCNQYFGSVYNEGYCRTCGRKLVQKRIRVFDGGR